MKEEMHSNQLDDFSEKIKQKLSNHAVMPPEDMWSAIKSEITPSKKIIPTWLHRAISAAAVIVLLVSVGNFFYIKDSVIPVSEEIQSYQQGTTEQLIAHQDMSVEVSTESGATAESSLFSTDSSKEKKQSQSKELNLILVKNDNQNSIKNEAEGSGVQVDKEAKASIEVMDIEAIDIVKIEETKEDAILSQTQKEEKLASEKSVKKLQELPQMVEVQADWTDNITPQKKKRHISLTAMASSGVAGSSSTIKPRSNSYKGESLMNLPTKYASVLTPRDFSHKEYLPPMSAGVGTRIPITERISMESGLQYTMLRTRLYTNATDVDFRASIDLHYLGVPASLVYSMIKNKRWDVYFVAGGMIEKGLQSDFRQHQTWDDTRVLVEGNSDIEGVQWSVNSSIGVGYVIYRNISLFFDPKLSYYIESNQPYSIRKELPVIFSLNTGLRVVL